MRSYRSALLAVPALALGAALVPVGAYADTATTTISTTELVNALKAAEAPTAAAATGGWVAQGTDAAKGSPSVSIKAIYAVDRGSVNVDDYTMLEAQHSGTYMPLSTLGTPRVVMRSLRAVKNPHATWIFMPDRSLDLRDPARDSVIAGAAPELLLTQAVDPARTRVTGTPSKTVAADGSTTYSFVQKDLKDDANSGSVSMTIDADGVCTAFTAVTATETDTVGFTYGPQQVTLPSAASTITMQLFTEGSFLADLPRAVKGAATQVAKQATRRAHHHAVTADAIRTAAKRGAKLANRAIGAKDFSTRSIAGGVRITGTNRYLHKHVAYTVTAAGTKALAHKA